MMYLSRIVLNPYHAKSYALASDPYGIHVRLCALFGAARRDVGLLFRVEDGPVILFQSSLPPDWEKWSEPIALLREPPRTKELAIAAEVGDRFSFRLRCRPSKKVKREGRKNSAFVNLRSDDEKLAWLQRMGAKHGFVIESAGLTPENWMDTKAPPEERKSLGAVQFNGVLVVTDPDKLREAVANGVGPQKAYGFGMLSLAREG